VLMILTESNDRIDKFPKLDPRREERQKADLVIDFGSAFFIE